MCSTCLMLLVQQASLMFCIISFASSRAFGLCCCLFLPVLPVKAPFIRATGGGRCCNRNWCATVIRLKRLFLLYGVSLPYFTGKEIRQPGQSSWREPDPAISSLHGMVTSNCIVVATMVIIPLLELTLFVHRFEV